MNRKRKLVLLVGISVVVAALVTLLTLSRRFRPITLTGVVIREDLDPRKQVPISDVEIAVSDGLALHDSKSDASGLFRLGLRPRLRRDQPIVITFRHPDYEPLDIFQSVRNKLYVIRMSPIPQPTSKVPSDPKTFIAQVSIRYSVKTSSEVDVGSTIKTFEVANTGNVVCRPPMPCSPDGIWKAAIGAMSLDAGQGNKFRNPRVSCIAGPCPFTKIDANNLAQDNRVLNVSVRDWSDPATFLVEAEVVHPMIGDILRQSYPAILGRNMSFSVPAEAEGVSMEAEVNGSRIVFPLGPDPCLSWAECKVKNERDHTSAYQCELKPGFEFR